MRTVQNPAGRIARLIMVVGAAALVVGLLWRLLNPQAAGISLPFTRTLFDIGWLIWLGLAWIIIGAVLWRASDQPTAETANARMTVDTALRDFRFATEQRLKDLDDKLKTINGSGQTSDYESRLDDLDARLGDIHYETAIINMDSRLNELDTRLTGLTDLSTRLSGLEANLNDAHNRMDSAGDVHGRLVALNARIDGLGHVQGRLDGHDRTLSEVQARLESLHAEFGVTDAELQGLSARLSNRSSDAAINALRAELGVTDAELQGLSARLNSLRDDIGRVHQRLDGLDHGTRLTAFDIRLQTPNAGQHDLKRIEGIGPKIEKALHQAGLIHFEDIAGASSETLRQAIEAGGIRFAPSLTTWGRQAQYLVAGDEAGLKSYQAALVAGREP
jgi:predicted  nucleic acid-binding Zn-ribbon protein